MTTKIEWTQKTWNPVTGCTKVSAGCKNCYAEKVADRFWGDRRFRDVRCHPERLDAPLRWRKPRRVFVNSMSDLFHEDVPDEFVVQVFAVMAHARKHTFQILTKRPDRMRRFMHSARERVRLAMHDVGRAIESSYSRHQLLTAYAKSGAEFDATFDEWPKRNVWLGVSCENQETADERIPLLLDTPAAVRFVSAEPLLGPIDLHNIIRHGAGWMDGQPASLRTDALTGFHATSAYTCRDSGPRLDWVIVGGESGPGARPCDAAWIRSIVEQCRGASAPVFVKQLGANYVDAPNGIGGRQARPDPGLVPAIKRLRDAKGGDPSEWPEDLRVREFPGESR